MPKEIVSGSGSDFISNTTQDFFYETRACLAILTVAAFPHNNWKVEVGVKTVNSKQIVIKYIGPDSELIVFQLLCSESECFNTKLCASVYSSTN